MEPAAVTVETAQAANPENAQAQVAEPGSKFGVALLTITFVFIALMILGDMFGFLFR
ncbi:MAG: hypothetical protein HY040_15310 [Planctomycetes bacterium]|nr:hypothetical protein [Planctomycetota bacterium]